MHSLREYQTDTLEHKLPVAFKAGHKKVCLYGPCGSGKTTIIAELCRRSVSKGGNVTVTAHRRRLIKQLAERMKAFGIRYSVEMATLPDEPWAVQDSFAEVVIGSKDTMLTRKKDISVRKTRLWIPDEAHCIAGAGYKELGDSIGAEFVIGPTATPCLSDGSGFGPKLFTELVISTTVEWLIANKYLVPVDPYAPVGAARRRREGLKQGVAGDPVKQWIDYAEGMRTVTFCRTLEECRAVRTMFVQAMIPAEHIDSESDDATRDDAIRRLQSGELKVLVCTPGLLGVGVDIPELECVQTLVKNISPIPFWQSIGRGQRIAPQKTRAILLDHAAAVFEHGLPNFSPAWKLGTDDSVQFRQLRRMSEKAEMKPVVCPACGYISTGGRCPKCNTLTVNRPGKRVVTDRENLAEVKEVEPIEKTQVEWRRILFICAAKGWNCLKAFVVFRGKFGKWPHDCGVEPPPSWDDRTKKVAEVWPWLVKGNV